MPSTDLADDELREVVREGPRKALKGELRSDGYGLAGLVVGALTAFLLW